MQTARALKDLAALTTLSEGGWSTAKSSRDMVKDNKSSQELEKESQFVKDGDIPQEISIQLWRINPCCPGTHFPMGDARKQKVADVLQCASQNTVFKMLNDGEPLKMGLHLGVSEAEAKTKNEELKNICLYCDHFMKCHKNDIFDKNGVKASK